MEPSCSSAINENEDFDESKLITEKVKLENGNYNFVFSRNVDETHKAHWRCNICDVIVGGSLSKHAMGRKHQLGLSLPAHPAILWSRSQPVPRPVLEMKLAPGEPVPPGFENEVRGITEIQASLDSYHSGPLIGLEYLIELSAYEDEREPQYICLLCDKRGDPRTVMAHLASFNHRMTYLMTHFPTAYRALHPYTKQFRRNVLNIVTAICEQIEKRYGRMVPQAADRETFDRTKQMYIENVSKDTHPSERMGETFEYMVDKEAIMAGPKDAMIEIKKANEEQFKGRQYRRTGSVPGCKDIDSSSKRDPSPPIVAAPVKNKSAPKQDRRSLSSISSISSSSLSSPHSRGSRSRSRSRSSHRYVRRGYPENIRRSRSRTHSPQRRFFRRASRSYSRSPPPRFRRDPYAPAPYFTKQAPRMPWQRPDYARSRIHYMDRRPDGQKPNFAKSDRMEEFKKQCGDIEQEMEKILEQHERNPEKHQMYPEEWKKFWNRRYKELQAENKDPTKHDFKPEWIDFWNKRMKEMHDGEVKAKKEALRKRLNLPEEPAPISFKIGNRKKFGDKSGSVEPCGSNPQNPNLIESDIIIIEDSKDDDVRGDRKRSHSPWEPDLPSRERERERISDRYPTDYSREYYKPKVYREPPRDHEREYKRKMPSPKITQIESETEINVVGILRLLTALEEKLGSLGPKVIDMLSKALALEKAEANSADTLLDNEVNCVLFETVKEKLKGQLLAGMVEQSSEKTFKNAIQKIASLLHFASERKKKKDKEMQKKIQEPVKIPGIGPIDKGAIAKQIATALIAQGKTDVTQAELEQLINAVVGMAQASHATGKPVSTASFVQQISNPSVSTDIAGLLQSSLLAATASKADSMTNALQLLQSSTPSTDPFSTGLPSSGAMDSLSDSELKTLLQNFKDLSTDEQHSLITYLKKLEAKEPERVERLRKFVKLGPSNNSDQEKSYTSGRISPFSNREAGVNPSVDDMDEPVKSAPASIVKQQPEKMNIDSDEDEDYSYEDVFRAASKNVNDKQIADEKRLEESKKTNDKSNVNLNDAKMLIANLMGQLGQKNNSGLNLLGMASNSIQQPLKTLSVDSSNGSVSSSNFTTMQQSPIPTVSSNLFPNQGSLPVASSGYTQAINPANPNMPAQQYPTQTPAQYNYPQNNRQYNSGYDNTYNQQNNYPGNQATPAAGGYNQPGMDPASADYNAYGNEYMNYGQHMQNTRQMPQQYGRGGPPGQYQQYNSRQNYY